MIVGRFLLILLGLCVLVAAGIGSSTESSMVPEILFRLLTTGPLLLVWLLACGGAGIWLTKICFRNQTRNQVITEIENLEDASQSFDVFQIGISIALGIGIYALLLLGLGLAGLLSTISAWLLIAVGGAVAVYELLKNRIAVSSFFARRVEPGHYFLLIATLPIGVMLAGGLVLPGLLWGDEPHGYDVLSYHLQIPREWFEAGIISPLSHNVFSYFPFNVEMHYLWAMHLTNGPWNGMFLTQWMHGTMAVLSAVIIYGACRNKGPAVASVCASVILCVPFVPMLGSVAYNEMGLMLFATCAWALARIGGSALKSGLMPGLMSGFAIGCKYTALPMVALPALILIFTRKDRKFSSVAAFVLGMCLTASPWLIRNVAWTGNPVFPIASAQLGGPFTPEQTHRFDVAHAPRPEQQTMVGRAMALSEQVLFDWKFGLGALLLASAIVVALFDIKKTWPLLVSLLVIVLVWLFATHLQGRFFVVALPLLAMLLATGKPKFVLPLVLVICAIGLIRGGEVARRVHNLQTFIGFDAIEQLTDGWLGQGAGKRLSNSIGPVQLVGDARAFWYAVPMSRLSYQTVFDVRTSWLPETKKNGVGDGGLIVVDADEIRRFIKTYKSLPEMPTNFQSLDRPTIMDGER